MDDTAFALRLLLFAYDTLEYTKCPDYVPTITIDPDLDCHGRIDFGFVPSIQLKQWDGSAYWQSVLAHELAHFLQYVNDEPFCEDEAERVRHAWLIQSSVPTSRHPLQLFS